VIAVDQIPLWAYPALFVLIVFAVSGWSLGGELYDLGRKRGWWK